MTRAVIRSIATIGTATLLLSGAAGIVGAQAADSSPPWEASGAVDVNETGTVALYDSSGQQVTSGSVTDSPIAAYLVGSTAAAGTKATAYLYTPKKGTAAGGWSGEQISLSTPYPVTGGPAAVSGAKGPVVTGSSTDESLATYIGDFPNTSTAAGYAGAYQLRIKSSSDGTYQALDLVVSGLTSSGGKVTGGTWSETYPSGGSAPSSLANTKRPKLSGKHKVGKKEKVSKGSWSPKPSSYSYQWFLGSKKIKGATKPTFKPVKHDAGKKISCEVTAKKSGFASAVATSKSVKIKK